MSERGSDRIDRWKLGRALAALAVLALAFGAAAPVAGHTFLDEADPGNGERLETLPEAVTLEFSGEGVHQARVTVTDPDGEVVSGATTIDPDDPRIVRVPLEGATAGLADGGALEGTYTVEWAVRADDGHVSAGSFVFVVGDAPIDGEAVLEGHDGDVDGASAVETGADAAALLALAALVGAPITAWIACYPLLGRFGVPGGEVDERLSRLLAGASLLLVVGVAGAGLATAASLEGATGDALAAYVDSPPGWGWLFQLAAAGALAAALLAAARRGFDRRYWLGGSVAGGLCVTLARATTSHSATAVGRLEGSAIDAAHVVGAGLWLGGLLVLAAVVPAVLAAVAPADRPRAAAAAIRRYSIVALTGVTLALTTGLVLAAWHAPTVEHLVGTLYGTALTTKTLLVVAALGLGGLVRVALLRRLEGRAGLLERPFGSRGTARAREDGGVPDDAVGTVTRAVRLEVAILLSVVVLSGLLTSTPTAVVGGHDDGPSSATVEREFDGGVLEVSVTPAHLVDWGVVYVDADAPVVLEATFRDEAGERSPSDRDVTVLAHAEESDARLTFDLEEGEDGTYSTVETLPADGRWELRISGESDGTFVNESIDAYAVPAEHQGHDHGDEVEADALTAALRLGAILVGLLGSVAVALETVRFGRRRE